MGFVKTKEELKVIQEVVGNPKFTNCEMLMVSFKSKLEIIERILPPGLEPGAEPMVTAMVGRWQSNCAGDFEGGAVYISAKYGEYEGTYVAAMYMDTDTAILYGREVFGEPKKQAKNKLYRLGNKIYGWVERKGVKIIELGAVLDKDIDISEPAKLANFNIKAWPATDGQGLESDAVLTYAELEFRLTKNQEGKGSVVLRGSVHDPLDEIEVVEVLGASYLEGDLIGKARSIATIPAESFLPYYYARTDVFSAPEMDTDHFLKDLK